MTVDVVKINRRLAIPMDELALSATRSSGPGGQNVNKVATQVMLRFDVAHSPSLTEWQRSRILSRLRNRITTDGELVLTSQEHRTQRANRAAAVERFAELLSEALRQPKPRKKTRPTKASVARRLESKRKRSQKKSSRSARFPIDE
jgi:ribosome-associated protein